MLLYNAAKLCHPSKVHKFIKLGSYISSSAPVEMSTSVKQLVDNSIKENKIAIFGKSWCSFSKRAKYILSQVADSKDIKYIDIDLTDDEAQIQGYLKSLNGQSTVPHVYINQEFIGGCSDVQRIQGSLKERLSK